MYNIFIKTISFEWDEEKNQTNIKKHGVDFLEAASIFDDQFAILFDDPDHSKEEDRFLIIGVSENDRMCIVSHCYKASEERIRIISARQADKQEREVYNEQFR